MLACTCLSVIAAGAQAPKAPAAKKAPAAQKGPTEPVKWLTDSEGREYRIDKLPKSQAHQKLPNGQLRTVWGFSVDLAGEDDTTWWVKVYRTKEPEKPPAPTAKEKAAEAAAIASSYAVTTTISHRLSFTPFDKGLPKQGQWRNGFVLADINEDGQLDIVHGPARKRPGPPVIFLGNGKGEWRQWSEATFPPGRYDYGDVAVADFDGNGHLDIAMGMHLLGVTALLHDGKGHFREGGRGMDNGATATGFSSRAIIATDWTGSGRPDVVALSDGPSMRGGGPLATPVQGLRLYVNAGNGTWTTPKTPQSPDFGDALATLRLADGRRAIVTGSNRLGSNDVLFVADGKGSWTIEHLTGVRPSALVGAVAVADFNGDGTDDIALGYRSFEANKWRTGVDLLLQQRNGEWKRQPVMVLASQAGISALAVGDLTGDGLPDLAVGSTGGRITVLLNGPKGVFTRETVPLADQGPSCRVFRLAIGDVSGDGRGDLVAALAGEDEGMLTLKSAGCPGEGSLRAWRNLPVSRPVSSSNPSPQQDGNTKKK